MESLELDVLALVTKQVHHHFQVGFIGNVPSHHIEVGPIQENLAKKLEGLALCDVVSGQDKCRKGREELRDA